MKMLDNYEFEVARELINIALAHAAQAFSKMAYESVLIKDVDLKVLDKEAFFSAQKEEIIPPIYTVTTEVKGAIQGKSYLMMDEEDIKKIIKTFTKTDFDPTQALTDFQQAVLLELDNILSAAMITQISNILNLFTYGDVPQFHLFSKEEAIDLFEKDLKKYDMALSIHAKFTSDKTFMSPSFMWLFKIEFCEAIKQLVKAKAHLGFVKDK